MEKWIKIKYRKNNKKQSRAFVFEPCYTVLLDMVPRLAYVLSFFGFSRLGTFCNYNNTAYVYSSFKNYDRIVHLLKCMLLQEAALPLVTFLVAVGL
jgi:hypothetical protein